MTIRKTAQEQIAEAAQAAGFELARGYGNWTGEIVARRRGREIHAEFAVNGSVTYLTLDGRRVTTGKLAVALGYLHAIGSQ